MGNQIIVPPDDSQEYLMFYMMAILESVALKSS